MATHAIDKPIPANITIGKVVWSAFLICIAVATILGGVWVLGAFR